MVCACMNLTLTEEQGLVHAYSYIEVIQQYRSIGFEDPHLHVYSWLALSNRRVGKLHHHINDSTSAAAAPNFSV